MRFRCTLCRAVTEIALPSGQGPLSVACLSCGRRHKISVRRPMKPADDGRYRKAQAFAQEQGLDLATAYSVLEGIMSLAEAQANRPQAAAPATAPRPMVAIPGGSRASSPTLAPSVAPIAGPTPSPARPPLAMTETRPIDLPALAPVASKTQADLMGSLGVRAAAPVGGIAEMEYDPGFRDAVRDGCLTVQQAAERGDRRELASRLAHRHRLPMALALQVADNRITVHKALQTKTEEEAREVPRSQTSISHGIWNFMITAMGALILSGLLVRAWHEWDEYLTVRAEASERPRVVLPAARPAEPPSAPPTTRAAAATASPAMTVARTDAAGQLIEVVGPDARSVLIAFCNGGRSAGHRRAFGVAPSMPPGSGVRMGLFTNLDQESQPMRAIRIRRDPRTGRWSAGDGRSPITTESAPPLSDGGRIVPVDSGLPDPPDEPETVTSPSTS
ncbi:MAG TPA: hypothetical protein VMQ62_01195 [Dongiaceae bacterium]|nr:hypothetical protein [Dongiaceae bacterium]